MSVKNFPAPPLDGQIFCETVNAAVPSPPGHCNFLHVVGNPNNGQYLNEFLRNVGSFNLGVAGGTNPLGNNIGAVEKSAAVIVAGALAPQQDALGIDYNGDGAGNGFGVSSLLGIHAVPPYGHNGACETLSCVVGDVKHRTANFSMLPDRLGNPVNQRQGGQVPGIDRRADQAVPLSKKLRPRRTPWAQPVHGRGRFSRLRPRSG